MSRYPRLPTSAGRGEYRASASVVIGPRSPSRSTSSTQSALSPSWDGSCTRFGGHGHRTGRSSVKSTKKRSVTARVGHGRESLGWSTGTFTPELPPRLISADRGDAGCPNRWWRGSSHRRTVYCVARRSLSRVASAAAGLRNRNRSSMAAARSARVAATTAALGMGPGR